MDLVIRNRSIFNMKYRESNINEGETSLYGYSLCNSFTFVPETLLLPKYSRVMEGSFGFAGFKLLTHFNHCHRG